MRVPLGVLPLWRLIPGVTGAVVAEGYRAVGKVQPGVLEVHGGLW